MPNEAAIPVENSPNKEPKKKMKLGAFLKKNSWLIATLLWGMILLYVWIAKDRLHHQQVTKLETAYKVQEDMSSKNMAMLIHVRDSIQGEMLVQRQLVVDMQSAYDLALLENSELKDQIGQMSITTITKIDTVKVPYKDTTGIIGKTMIRVPKDFALDNSFYSIRGTVRYDAVYVEPMVKNMQTITIGEARPEGAFSFLKAKVPVIEIKNTNPYVETISMSNVMIAKDPPMWYETRIFQIAASLAGGLMLGLLISN